MLILSQDKETIYNFNNIISIQIEEGYNRFNLVVYGAITNYTSLGKYKTEERAKEVLQEIIETYKESGIVKIDNVQVENKVVYEMPEKIEV